MDISKIKVKQKRRYQSKANAGVGTVTNIETKKTGAWVTLNDQKRGVYVTVRPSQVSPL